jgi:hypothetical protein
MDASFHIPSSLLFTKHSIFNLPNPSSCTVDLGSTQPLTEMCTSNLPGGKGRPALKADSLTAICEPIVQKMWEPRRLTTQWASMACDNDSFTFLLITLHPTPCNLQSIRGDETVNINKPSPMSPQLTARSGQSAQFRVLTAFGRTLTCIQTLDTPAKVNPSRDRCMISF